MDPHKKGYISENDWINALGNFNHLDSKFEELAAILSSSFAD